MSLFFTTCATKLQQVIPTLGTTTYVLVQYTYKQPFIVVEKSSQECA